MNDRMVLKFGNPSVTLTLCTRVTGSYQPQAQLIDETNIHPAYIKKKNNKWKILREKKYNWPSLVEIEKKSCIRNLH